MMKHFLFVLTTVLMLSWNVNGQDSTTFKPGKGDHGFAVNINGLLQNINLSPYSNQMGKPTIFYRYYMKEDVALRAGVGLQSNWYNMQRTDSLGASQVRRDTSFSQPTLSLSLGIEKHLGNSPRFDPYIGAEVALGIIGKQRVSSFTIVNDTTGEDITEMEYIEDGGAQVSLRGLAGFNFFVYPKLSIGAEYGFMCYFATQGGDWRRTVISTPISGVTSSTRQLGSNRTQQIGYEVDNTVTLTLSYFFARKDT